MKKILDNRVINIKIYVNGRSEEIQEKLFELGCQWPVNGKCVFYEDSPFLYVDEDGLLRAGNKMSNFVNKKYREVKADEILAMEKTEEPKNEEVFKPFDKVLARDEDNHLWMPNFFSFKDNGCDYPFCMINGAEYRQCIPYEGNEHLAFKVTK